MFVADTLANSMRAFYPLKEDTRDLGPHHLDGHSTPAVTFVPSALGKAADFSGDGASIVLPNHVASPSTSGTISACVQLADATTTPEFGQIFAAFGVNRQTGALRLGNLESPVRLQPLRLHHVAVTWRGPNLEFFVDGEPAGGGVLTTGLSWFGSIGDRLGGTCSDVIVFDTAIDLAAAQFLAGRISDATSDKVRRSPWHLAIAGLAVILYAIGRAQEYFAQLPEPTRIAIADHAFSVTDPVRRLVESQLISAPGRARVERTYSFTVAANTTSLVVHVRDESGANAMFAVIPPGRLARLPFARYPADDARQYENLQTHEGRPYVGSNTGEHGLLVRAARLEFLPPGDWQVFVRYQTYDPSYSPAVLVQTRTLALPRSSRELYTTYGLQLLPRLALTEHSAGNIAEFTRIAQAAMEGASNLWRRHGLHLHWAPLEPIRISDPLTRWPNETANLVARTASTQFCTVIFTDLIPDVRGQAGALAGITTSDGYRSGVLVSLFSNFLGGTPLTRLDVARGTAHELGHWLGLTHSSSDEVVGNLMRRDPGNYGDDLNQLQVGIALSHPQVEIEVEYLPDSKGG